MVLTDTAATGMDTLISNAKTATSGFLEIGTMLFDWAINNPIYALGVVMFIIIFVAGLIRHFTHR